MASKHPAYHMAGIPRLSPSSASPSPEIARRLRAAFPEIWARYEWLCAARAVARRMHKSS
jgi:hypothetical protein